MPDDQTPDPTPPSRLLPPTSQPLEPLPAVLANPMPTIVSRKEMRQARQKTTASRAWWYVIGGVAVGVIALVIGLTINSGSKNIAANKPAVVSTTTPPAPVTTVAAPTCPLTGTAAPGGAVPPRPALGVKIGNYPDDRPSAGLNQSDIVFEEPVEGGITRLVAVFQCQAPTLVGDLRSARQPDVGILSQLSDPLFVHAGGIDPVIALLKAGALIDKNLYEGSNSSAIIQHPGRVAPYSTFVNTASLWAFDPTDTTPPASIFSFSATPPAGSVAGSGISVHIPFSSTSDVTWTWNPTNSDYLRSYAGTPDKLLDGSQTAAANVVVMTVQTATGTWVENEQGGHEVLVTPTGTGPLVVMRNGVAITGTWSRSSLTQPATLTATDGKAITLEPGNTWEELVPAGITVTPLPGAAAATPTTTAPAATTTTKTK